MHWSRALLRRKLTSKTRQSGRFKPRVGRQFESLEAKVLLAGDATAAGKSVVDMSAQTATVDYALPIGQLEVETYAETRQRIFDNALQTASELSNYSAEQLQSAKSWVINFHAEASVDISQLTNALDAVVLEPTQIVDHTFVYEPAADLTATDVIARLQGRGEIRYFYPLVTGIGVTKAIPDDPYFGDQWHLQNTGQSGGTSGADANLTNVWDQYRGTGVVLAIVDDGVEFTHPDLAPNYNASLQIDTADGDNDPTPQPGADFHGTAVAGVAAASGFDGVGALGVAPSVTLTGIRAITGGLNDTVTAQAISHMNDEIDVYNNSWGAPDFTGALSVTSPLTLVAMFDSATNGRNGLGNVHPWAGGNGLQGGDNVNQDVWAVSAYSLAITAIDHNGVQTDYAEPGSSIVVSTYSASADAQGNSIGGIVTTDLLGADGYNSVVANTDGDPFPDIDYTGEFSGTSSATPLASGVVALMLEANPSLTYRDVTEILLDTAIQNDPNDNQWIVNGAGRPVNEKYGFGAIDAEAAVRAAESWVTLPPEELFTTGTVQSGITLPDDQQTGVDISLSIPNQGGEFSVEYVELILDTTHFYSTDLEIVLTSPSGTTSRLAEGHIPFFQPPPDYDNWALTTTHFWGEDLEGDWNLNIFDAVALDQGVLETFELVFHTAQQGDSFLQGAKFADVNGNGVRDFGEQGLADWQIYLDTDDNGQFDAGEPTTVTSAQGNYTFPVVPGDYVVREVAQDNWTQVSPIGGGAHRVTVEVDTIVSGLDFANRPDPGTVSGVIWNDVNENGIRDDEPGLERIELFLDRNNDGIQDTTEETTTSGIDGSYTFASAAYGDAVVMQVLPDGIDQTFPANGSGHSIFIDAGDVITGLNFGNHFEPGTIAGFVWRDHNSNGERDSGELGMNQILVYLDTNGDAQVSLSEPSTYTNSIGRYEFADVQPGEYSVRVAPMLGFAQSFPLDNEGYEHTVMPNDLLVGNSFGLRGFSADFGDAPFPYPTRFTNGGAAHEFVSGPILGSIVSPDLNGQPSDGALADDDDGVRFLTAIEAGQRATVEVTASVAGRVSAWIDFDRDGKWDATAEQVITAQQVGATPVTFSFDVPETTVPGTSYARFRISSDQNLLPTGVATDGEVEDYAVTLINNIPDPDDPTDPGTGGSGTGGGTTIPESFTNPSNPNDVDNNGRVAITDAIAIIAELRAGGARALAAPTGPVSMFVDTNGDNRITLSDALAVVRALVIGLNTGAGEADSVVTATNKTAEPAKATQAVKGAVIDDSAVASRHDQALLAESAKRSVDSEAVTGPSDELEESVSLIADDLHSQA